MSAPSPAPRSIASGPFVFLDRDGTIIEDRHYLADPAGVRLLPHVTEGLRLLRDAGRCMVVVTNQSGIGRGMFTEEQMHAVNARMRELLLARGIELAGIYWCPHVPEAGCPCRKPAAGLVAQTLQDLGGDLRDACIIGDTLADHQLARTIGAVSVHVRTGREPLLPPVTSPPPDIDAPTLAEAARLLLSR